MISEDKHGLNILESLCLVLFEWWRFKRPFNTGRRYLETSLGIKDDHNHLIEVKSTEFKGKEFRDIDD